MFIFTFKLTFKVSKYLLCLNVNEPLNTLIAIPEHCETHHHLFFFHHAISNAEYERLSMSIRNKLQLIHQRKKKTTINRFI